MTPRRGEAGFTLIEVLISLTLFSLIGVAGFTLVDSIVRVQTRTDGRLETLGAQQRAMHLMTLDFEQAASSQGLTYDGAGVSFRRLSGGAGEGVISIRYALYDGVLIRSLGGAGGGQSQALIEDVESAKWRFYTPQTGWLDVWPPATGTPPAAPRGVALTLTLTDQPSRPGGTLRRVVELPAAIPE